MTTFSCYVILTYGGYELNGIILPMIFVFVLAYCVVTLFSEIFGMCIDTMMMCFIADEEMFPPEKRFADGALKTSVTSSAQAAASSKVVPLNSQVIHVRDIYY